MLAGVAAGCRYTADLELPSAQAESTKVLAADGSLLANLHDEENRDPVALEAIAPVLRDAVVAIEDARYFEHDGVDPRGVVRALTRDIEAGTAEEGGSTITQQYVRAVMLDTDKTLIRKLHEAVLAIQLEHKFSKRQILQRYLNTVYFGNGAYGVEAAAQVYFAKPARNVDLPQAALLAGLIQAPNRTDPYQDPAGAQLRRDVVIDRMAELDRIDPAAAAAAKSAPLGVAPEPAAPRHPAAHFVEQVKKQIVHDPAIGPAIGPDEAARERRLFTGGLRVETTLDPKLQGLAEEAVAQVLPDPATDPEAAVVSIDPTNGHVVAYVGGRDYFGTAPSAQFDLAENDAGRSSGSAFKPFVLAAALDAGIPLTRTYKAPGQMTIPIEGQEPWDVSNYEGQADGSRMDLTEATVKSVNTVYAQLMMDVGPQVAVDEAKRLGIVTTALDAVPSAVLGTNEVTPLDMASAFSVFAGDGLRADPVFITRVTTRDGTVLYDAPAARHRVLSTLTARRVNEVLQQVVTDGTGVKARIGRQVAGKTGTAEDYSDAWFVGYTPELSTAVWIGFPDDTTAMVSPTTRVTVTGGTWPAEIWQSYQGAALADRPATTFGSVEDAEAEARDAAKGSTTTSRAGVRLPSVVGMREADARRVLAPTGMTVETETTPSNQYPPGVVLRQSPPGGTVLRRGDDTITLTLAVEPPPTAAVPSVLGLSADDARRVVEGRGLVIDITELAEPPPGDTTRAARAWKQAPVGGTTVDVGSTVEIWVNPAVPPAVPTPAPAAVP
ncbi:MAG: transglycosylase domain-containing protein [Acidimicrobiia bacterium]